MLWEKLMSGGITKCPAYTPGIIFEYMKVQLRYFANAISMFLQEVW